MQKKIKRYIGILLLLVSFIAANCSLKRSNKSGEIKVLQLLNDSNDSIKISTAPDGDYTGTYYAVKEFEKQLKLKTLDKNDNNFEFRVWFDLPGLALHQRLFVLRFEKGKFACDLIRFEISWSKDRKTEPTVIISQKTQGTPKSGWDNFSKQVFSRDFPVIFDIKKMPVITTYVDGQVFCFELISNKSYWMSEFNDPEIEEQKGSVFLEVENIVKTIEKEFDISRRVFHKPDEGSSK